MSSLSQETKKLSLFAILLGCTPRGRNTEQHDVMFGVARSLNDLGESMKIFWHKPLVAEVIENLRKINPKANTDLVEKELFAEVVHRDKVHIDAWVQVNYVDGYSVNILPKSALGGNNGLRLYFINLGGYKKDEFEEIHKKFFVVGANMGEALAKAKAHAFMKEYSSDAPGRASVAHLDDQHKMNFEEDDIICVSDDLEGEYAIQLEQVAEHPENELVIGYKKLNYAE